MTKWFTVEDIEENIKNSVDERYSVCSRVEDDLKTSNSESSSPITTCSSLNVNDVKCIDIIGDMKYCSANAIKYIWKAENRDDDNENSINDLKKAKWFIERELKKLQKT